MIDSAPGPPHSLALDEFFVGSRKECLRVWTLEPKDLVPTSAALVTLEKPRDLGEVV